MGAPGDGWTAEQVRTRADLAAALKSMKARARRDDHRPVSIDMILETQPPAGVAPFVLARPTRSSVANWVNGTSVPRDGQEPGFLWVVSALGTPRQDFSAWLTALDRARSDTGRAVPAQPPAPEPAVTTPAAPGRVRRTTVGWVVVAAAIVIGLVGLVVAFGTPDDRGTTTEAGPRSVVLEDDFNSPGLDPDRWLAPYSGQLIRPEDGVLALAVSGTGPDTGVVDRLSPRTTEPFTRLDADITVEAVDSIGPGFADITVVDSANRPHRVLFGPTITTGRPEVTAQTCDQPTCTAYDDYTEPTAQVPLTLGEPQQVRFDVTDGRLLITLSDTVIGDVEVEGPLTAVTIEISAAGTERWAATIDNLRLTA